MFKASQGCTVSLCLKTKQTSKKAKQNSQNLETKSSTSTDTSTAYDLYNLTLGKLRKKGREAVGARE